MRSRSTRIDFAPSRWGWWFGHASSSWGRVLTLLLLLSAMGALAWSLASSHAATQERLALTDEVLVAERQAQAMQRSPVRAAVQPKLSESQWRRYGDVVAQLNAPWPAIFDLMERTKVQNVALIGLEPDMQARRIRIVIEGKSLADLYAYLERLSQAPEVSGVRPLRHEVQDKHPYQPIRMTADVDWQAASAGVSP